MRLTVKTDASTKGKIVNPQEPMKLNKDHLKEMAAKRREVIQREHEKTVEIQAKAAHGFSRLLRIAETEDTGQAQKIAKFLAATFNGRSFPLDLFEIRNLDFAIGDDMILCIDAHMRASADLCKLVPNGYARVKGVIEKWHLSTI
jgi:hypothetical protein